MKLISFKICPFVQRVAALLEAKNITYEIEYISLSNKPDWFMEISPHGQVPVLITDNGMSLFESEAIVEYLEEAYPALQPDISLEEKAGERAWSYLASKNYLQQCSAQSSPDENTLKERSRKLEQAFDKIENQLGDTRYFGSDSIGLVDIAWMTLLHRADIIDRRSGYDYIGDRPKMKRWQANLMQTGLAEKSVSPDFEDVFADYYLSDKTFLGRGGRNVSMPVEDGCATGNCC